MFRKVLIAVGIVGFMGQFLVLVWGDLCNEEGDGLNPQDTLLAALLGYERAFPCELDPGNGWDCNPFAPVLIADEEPGASPVAVWMARWIGGAVHFIFFVALILIGIPPDRKDEETKTG